MRVEVRKVFDTRLEAVQAQAACRAAITGADLDSTPEQVEKVMQMTELVVRYIIEKEAMDGISKKHADSIIRIAWRWNDYMGKPVDRAISDVKASHVTKAINFRLSMDAHGTGKVSRSTVAKEFGILKAFARWAHDKGLLPSTSPLLTMRVKKKKRDMHHGGKVACLPIHEIQQAILRIDKTAPHVANFLIGMILLGARPGAICDLDWSMVTMPKDKQNPGEVRFPILKDGLAHPPLVKYGSQLHRLLVMCKEQFAEYYSFTPFGLHPVFCTIRGRSHKNPRGWSSTTIGDRIRAGREEWKLPRDFVSYVARHSSINSLQNCPRQTPASVAEFAGHRRLETQGNYHHQRTDVISGYDAMADLLDIELLPDRFKDS
jgi:integrase